MATNGKTAVARIIAKRGFVFRRLMRPSPDNSLVAPRRGYSPRRSLTSRTRRRSSLDAAIDHPEASIPASASQGEFSLVIRRQIHRARARDRARSKATKSHDLASQRTPNHDRAHARNSPLQRIAPTIASSKNEHVHGHERDHGSEVTHGARTTLRRRRVPDGKSMKQSWRRPPIGTRVPKGRGTSTNRRRPPDDSRGCRRGRRRAG